MTERICEYRHCDLDISHMKASARFCCPAHKAAEDRLVKGRWVREPRSTSGDGTVPSSTAARRRRRRNRDGSGTRIYVTPQNLADLRAGHITDDVRSKLDEAAQRIEARR
jgi:hypothetical protein